MNQLLEIMESFGVVAFVGCVAVVAAWAVMKVDALTFRRPVGPMFMRGEIRCYLNRTTFGRCRK